MPRFARLLERIAQEIIARPQGAGSASTIGRPLSTREEYRQIVLDVLGAALRVRYRYDGNRLVMLRIFHGRESR